MAARKPESTKKQGLAWPPLIEGRLVKRYKRFLADVALADGTVVTAHCPNSGSMTGCSEPGRPVFVSHHDNPKRKLAYTWELIEMPTSLVGVNTLVPNRLVVSALRRGLVSHFQAYTQVTPEIRISAETRLDVKVAQAGLPDCFIEIKNCTLVEGGRAMFPDARTIRGRKHLKTLADLHARGARSVIFFLVQRMDADLFSPAAHIDSEYARLLRQVFEAGVEIMVYDVHLDLHGIRLNRELAFEV